MRKMIGIVALCLAVSAGAHADEPTWSGDHEYVCPGTTSHSVEADVDSGVLHAAVSVGSHRLRDLGQPASGCVHAEINARWDDVVPDATYRVVGRLRSTGAPSAEASSPLPKRVPSSSDASLDVSLGAYAFECSDAESGEPYFCAGGGSPEIRELCSLDGPCDDQGTFELATDVVTGADVSYLRVSVELRADAQRWPHGTASVAGGLVLEDLTVTRL